MPRVNRPHHELGMWHMHLSIEDFVLFWSVKLQDVKNEYGEGFVQVWQFKISYIPEWVEEGGDSGGGGCLSG